MKLDPQRPLERRLARTEFVALVAVGIFLIAAAFAAGLLASPYVRGQVAPPPTPADAARQQFDVFWQAWSLVEQNYVRQTSVDHEQMTYGAIRGMLDALDDEGHTRFLSPEDVRLEDTNLRGRFDGIGAEVTMRSGRPTIVAPIEGSPAERVGVRAGDIILRVNDQDAAEWTLTELVSRIRGQRGTPVVLTLLRANEPNPFRVTLVRDEIQVNAVSWAMVPDTKYAHLRIAQFSQTTTSELRTAIDEARAAGAAGLIVDLRNNPGGLLDQAVDATSEFLASGNVLLQEDREGQRRAYPVRGGGKATDLPLVVLVNEGSASAAEIFAGAIQDHQRGAVIGEKTFGTGTVLSSFPLSDGSAILLGTAQWLTPNGRAIWKQGISPDEVISLPPSAEPVSPRRERTMSSIDLHTSNDAQLLHAIEVLGANQVAPVGAGVNGAAPSSPLEPVPAN